LANPRRPVLEPRAKIRCAIYTRKSSEEGLEQEFNSLDAQREACEAYVMSQKHEGWSAIPSLYDDGGYSAGTMDRPALLRMLEDVRAKKIDAVVVYKVDRLTRSLADFAKIVEVFDAQGVSFVSITQAFNTSTSMGRLTLNVLLSFAQFEREVTGERIRDKIAASKKKGMWMGGLPSLGYDVKERKLVVSEAEAATVRHIYQRYLELGSVRLLQDDLDAAGIVSKRRVASDGGVYGAQRFSRGALYLMLKNRIYRGEIVHKGKAFPGEHQAIIDETLWSKVQLHLKENHDERHRHATEREASLLTGILFDAQSNPMTPVRNLKKSTRYRYYISRTLLTGTVTDNPDGQRVPAPNLEALIIDRVRSLIANPIELLSAVPQSHVDTPTQRRLRDAASELSQRWEKLSTESLHNLLRGILVRVQVHAERIALDVDAATLIATLLESDEGDFATTAPAANDGEERHLIALSIPASLKRTGIEMKFIVPGAENREPPNASLVRLVLRAQALGKRLFESSATSLDDIAREDKMNPSYASRLVRLTFLAPDITAAILAGQQPAELSATKLMTDTRLPLDWREQRTVLGFA
jgi:site-specific DNA recombinase